MSEAKTVPRRRVVDAPPTSQPTNLEPPSPEDVDHAVVTQLYLAREELSSAERAAVSLRLGGKGAKAAINSVQAALAQLRSCVHLLQSECSFVADNDAQRFVLRALRAAEAVDAHIGHWLTYEVEATPSGFEKRQSEHLLGVWRRSAEAARQETHRALSAAIKLFPHAALLETECGGDDE